MIKYYICLPLCKKGDDKYGRWQLSKETNIEDVAKHILVDPVKYGSIPEVGKWINEQNRSELREENHPLLTALHYYQVWLPDNCSYHRFSNNSLFLCVKVLQQLIEAEQIRSAAKSSPSLQIIFMGDSALRGIFCGITRILAGSEIYGPCINTVCGGLWNAARGAPDMPKTIMSFGKFFDLDYFGGSLRLTFVYVTKFSYRHLDWILESAVRNLKPYALVFNTGAWDFDADARAHLNSTAADDCDSEETLRISLGRISPEINHTMQEISQIAAELGVRLIYRNSHHNKRYGAVCADKRFEEMITSFNSSHWEIWDNRNLSRDIWPLQCFDGFHFDRYQVHSREQHKHHMLNYRANPRYNGSLPGQLEMQFAHSLLNFLFYDAIYAAFDPPTNPPGIYITTKKRKTSQRGKILTKELEPEQGNDFDWRMPLVAIAIFLDEYKSKWS